MTMKIAVYSQYYKGNEASFSALLEALSKKKSEVFVEENFFQLITEQLDFKTSVPIKTFQALDESFDLLISIGGDGTILRAITYVSNLAIPIIGVNTGRLGFLATIQNNRDRKSVV